MKRLLLLTCAMTGLVACTSGTKSGVSSTTKECAVNKKNQASVKLLTVAPGHFHAYLVQNRMYPQLSPDVNVYAPEGPEVEAHLKKIESFNAREKDPTAWKTTVYRGDDFLQKMLQEKKGNLVVLAGNNANKTRYILESVKAGLNVLSDKPMAINP